MTHSHYTPCLQDPLQSTSQSLKNAARFRTSYWQATVVEEIRIPCETEQMIARRVDGNDAKGILDVGLTHKWISAKLIQQRYDMV